MKGVMRGSGTQADPYLVEDFSDFKTIGNYTLAEFKQVNDIKVEAGYNPIDINLIRYDGNGYKITGLNLYYDGASTTEGYVTRRYTLGLFGKARGCGLVNINLENINIEYNYNYTDSYIAVGGLVGEVVIYDKPVLRDNNTIKNCSVTGVVKSLSKDMDNWKALSYVGGLIGRINISQGNSGDTQYTYSNKFKGSVTGCGRVGGHIGDKVLTTGKGESTNVFIGEINVLAYSQLGKCKGEQSRAGGFYASGSSNYSLGGHVGDIKIRVEDNLTGYIGTISSEGDCYKAGLYVDIDISNSKCELTLSGTDNGYTIGTVKVGGNTVRYPSGQHYLDLTIDKDYELYFTDNKVLNKEHMNLVTSTSIPIEKFNGPSTTLEMQTKETYTKFNNVYIINSLVYLNNYKDIQKGDVYVFDKGIVQTAGYTTFRAIACGVYDGSNWTEHHVWEIKNPILESDTKPAYSSIFSEGDIVYWDSVFDEYRGTYIVQSQTLVKVSNDNTIITVIPYNKTSNLLNMCEITIGDNNYITQYYYNESEEIEYSLYSYTYRYDFTNIWGIDPDINYGYPYLLGLDYSDLFDDIFDDILTYIRVQVAGRIVTIPVYPDTGTDKLVVNTHKGLGGIKLVDVDDSKATPIRIKLQSGIKSLSE